MYVVQISDACSICRQDAIQSPPGATLTLSLTPLAGGSVYSVSPLEETQWSRGVSFFCERAWTQKDIHPLLHAIGYLFPA